MSRKRSQRAVLLALGLGLCLLGPGSAVADDPPARKPAAELSAAVDAALAASWKEEGLRPVRAAKDVELLRRISLDLCGAIPSEQVTRNYLAGKGKDRPARLIQTLLYSEEYATFQATRWANLLVGRSYLANDPEGQAPLVKWLAQRIAGNTPWNVVVSELLSAVGTRAESGAVDYLLRYRNRPEEMAGNAMRVFQGLSVQCAQCHDHPYKENWRQRDFWGVAAYFARTRVRRQNDIDRLYEAEQGQVRIPGKPGMPGPEVGPRFITGESTDPGEGDYRREELARILTSSSNPYFARATVNRVWSFFFGAGFTDPNDLAKPSHPRVLELLEADFQASGYDLRRLITIILSTKAYQRASSGSEKDLTLQTDAFARARLRPLTPEQLWRSIARATALDDNLAPLPEEERTNRRRALRRQFNLVFAAGIEDSALEQQTITQALALLNGPLTNDLLWVGPKNAYFKRLLEMSQKEQVGTLFLRVLSRPASRAELKALTTRAQSSQDKVFHLQDVVWALMNSSEFLYNH